VCEPLERVTPERTEGRETYVATAQESESAPKARLGRAVGKGLSRPTPLIGKLETVSGNYHESPSEEREIGQRRSAEIRWACRHGELPAHGGKKAPSGAGGGKD